MAFLTVLAAAASIFLLASLDKPAESAIDRDGGTRVTLTPRTSDGSPLTPGALSQAGRVIGKRVSGARIDTSGNTLTVTVPGQNQPNIENLGRRGQLSVRPVLHSLAANPLQIPGRGRVRGGLRDPDLSEGITREKQLRQSTMQAIQFLAMQFQATRCDEPDALAGYDDPGLPLITCSENHKAVYLLGPSIVSGSQVREARSRYVEQSGRYVIDLRLDTTASGTLSQFAATHRRKQVAYTLDTAVISAPEVKGSAQITSDLTGFTSEGARRLANTLNAGPLPCRFDTSQPEAVAPKEDSAGLWQTRPPIGLVVTAIGLVVILLGLQVYLYRHGGNRPPGAAAQQP